LQGIPPGEYTVYAFEEVEQGPQWEPGYFKTVTKYGSKVTIKDGSKEAVKIEWIPAAETPLEP